MILLDTDHFSAFQRRGVRADTLRDRMRDRAEETFALTIVTAEEEMRGWIAAIHRAPAGPEQVRFYDSLLALFRSLGKWTVIPFDAIAAKRFLDLKRQGIRVGTMDLKIAAIALAHDAMLLPANLRDFQAVPDLRVENSLD